MSDMVFNYAPDDNPIIFRLREQLNLRPCQVIVSNQLFLERNRHVIPTNCDVIMQCKIGHNAAADSKEKIKFSHESISSFIFSDFIATLVQIIIFLSMFDDKRLARIFFELFKC